MGSPAGLIPTMTLLLPTDLSFASPDSDSREPSRKPESASVEDMQVSATRDWSSQYAKLPKSHPKIWKPFLDSFTLFPKLPIEIRQICWKLSLAARVVEVRFNRTHGFFTPIKIPVALRVCKDSRDAVKNLYPLCFGTVVHEPAIVFNFSMDTMYLDADLGPEVVPFIYSWKGFEAQNIQSLAVDRYLDDYIEEWGSGSDFEGIKVIQQATHHMPALKEVFLVVKLDDFWHDHGFPEGDGDIVLMESFSHDLQQYMYHECWHLDDEDGESECQELPDLEPFLKNFQAPVKSAIWGWRPTELPLEPYPWDMDSEAVMHNGDGL